MLTVKDWDKRFAQQAVWTLSLRKYIYDRVGLRQLNHIIEIGCGTGAILADFNNQQGKHIFGLDISEKFIRLVKEKNTSALLAVGDAHALPFKEGSFDMILCHFFLLWIKDPILVLHEMRRIANRDGFILILAEPDYIGRVDYPDELTEIGQAQIKSLISQGADPFIGRRLGSLFRDAGISLVEMGILGGQWGPRQYDSLEDKEWQIILHDLQFLQEEADTTLMQQLELENLRKVHLNAVQTGERVLFIPTFYAWGRVNK
jgi:SAM-dependent methyltransferase